MQNLCWQVGVNSRHVVVAKKAMVAISDASCFGAYLDWICVLKSERHNKVAQALLASIHDTGIWNNYHPKTSKETLMNFYTPLVYDGKIAGVITGYIEATSQIVPLFETTLYGQEIYGLLVDENDMVICSTIESDYVKDLTLDMFVERFDADTDKLQRIHEILRNASETAVSFKNPKAVASRTNMLLEAIFWHA